MTDPTPLFQIGDRVTVVPLLQPAHVNVPVHDRQLTMLGWMYWLGDMDPYPAHNGNRPTRSWWFERHLVPAGMEGTTA